MKRYQGRPSEAHELRNYMQGIQNPQVAARLGEIAASFVHLEHSMGLLLGILLGDAESETAGFVLRAIASPRARTEVLRGLLERAPHNKDLGPEYDDYLARFSEISIRRNRFVHGLWWTHMSNGSVIFAPENGDGFGFARAEEASVSGLDKLLQDILDLKTALVANLILGEDGYVERRRRLGLSARGSLS